jgi:signal transduction histidine kinase
VRLGVLTVSAVFPAGKDRPGGPLSAREAAALAGARERAIRLQGWLRRVLWVVLAVVVYAVLGGRMRPGWAGAHLGVAVALAGVCLSIGLAAAGMWPMSRLWARAVLSVLAGACGLLLQALQPSYLAAASLPANFAVLTAALLLPLALGAVIAGALTCGLLAEAWLVPGGSLVSMASELSFCATLVVMALTMRRADENQVRAEVLLARLEDAREAEARAVVLAERTRIARELHDVLAQSLSGLAVQLEGARRLARREQAGAQLQAVIERSGALVKEGLEDARKAVAALREASGQVLDRLPELVERYRTDHLMDAHLRIEGEPRELPPDTGLALYRGAQEALTNAARHAPGSRTSLTLRYEAARVVLTVQDLGAGPSARPPAARPGLGLIGLRERLAQVGGTATAGPAGDGWHVRMEVTV